MQLDVSFFIIPEQLPHPTIGFNTEKVIADSHPKFPVTSNCQ